ncbi:hypothetical protein MASR2M78_34750 [Treponema sp.]
MMTEGKTVLVLLTGFLGSGKTTVLNDALAELHDKRVAVVVNEWGKQGVDGALLGDRCPSGITEIAGGQIFCSCVAGTLYGSYEAHRFL